MIEIMDKIFAKSTHRLSQVNQKVSQGSAGRLLNEPGHNKVMKKIKNAGGYFHKGGDRASSIY